MAERPQNSFAERREMSLDEFRQQAIEAQSQMASIRLKCDNDQIFEVPHPMLISDAAQVRLEKVQSFQDLDRDENGMIKEPLTINGKEAGPLTIRVAKALLGDAEHKKFIAAGGHSNDITLAWEYLAREHKKRAEEDPK